MDDELRRSALHYHQFPKPGKIQVAPTKPLASQRDLALAYSPGVAAACDAIVEDPANAYAYTARGNLVAVISNGTAVLGLGDIGALAGKPVMEGKGVLFKKFAGIDVFDIEVNEKDPDKLVDIIASLEPTFGGINLEDIKAPECFYIERKLREKMKIPVFHDDQHGTAIITAAAVLNGLRIVGKDISKVKLVTSGAGAAAVACLDLLVALGVHMDNIVMCDSKGVVHTAREDWEKLDESKRRYAKTTDARALKDAIVNADIFLGLSGPKLVTQDMVKTMAAHPLILALANPEPEILPPLAKEARPDAIICTGRSDFPNQVNNVLCFPFIFRGALDVGATTINEEMKLACVRAIADLAMAEQSDVVADAYVGQNLSFGPDYIIPKPFDPRLILKIAPAVAKAAMDSGIATRPIKDMQAYTDELTQFVYKSNLFMKPVFSLAKSAKKRVVYAEGEDERVLHGVQEVVDQGLAYPILIGRPHVIEQRIQRLGLRIKPGVDFELVNNENDPRYGEYWQAYYEIMQRKGVSIQFARREVRRKTTLIGALMLRRGEADAMICGTYGQYQNHLEFIEQVIGLRPGVKTFGAMNALILPHGNVFIADTYVNPDPTAEQLAEITRMAADTVRRFGIAPKVALLSHSSFGTVNTPSASKMRQVLEILNQTSPDLEVEGEMHGDAALSGAIRQLVFPNARFKEDANILIMPTLDAANISFNLLKVSAADGVTIGPILLGAAKPVHILTPTASPRRVVNMTALAVVDATV
ncbi:malate dehydrogenase (oxaloacetate-decarboxylating)(NADP+) [Chitinivorax tropicus]|uniref:Malate dehydrogenase (Oxaloacetate-decarboxylating)(NADP+) n=1 Tax=Chitinivorax tropicus TaxID=714531 RepID=A0A840MMY7_9PROT|nr:NADP-dependent malic enzyme [Chitinivorax tropicus]MBB5018469.1 malate dehydrogenase (oxaloacetate-decarboxylating)(NADP+) [Chitinivorax tropicus]